MKTPNTIDTDVLDIAEHFSAIADFLEEGDDYTWQSADNDTSVRMSAAAAKSELLDAFERLAEMRKGVGLEDRVAWLLTLHAAWAAVLPYLEFAIEQPAIARGVLPSFGRHVRELADVMYAALMDTARSSAPPGHS